MFGGAGAPGLSARQSLFLPFPRDPAKKEFMKSYCQISRKASKNAGEMMVPEGQQSVQAMLSPLRWR